MGERGERGEGNGESQSGRVTGRRVLQRGGLKFVTISLFLSPNASYACVRVCARVWREIPILILPLHGTHTHALILPLYTHTQREPKVVLSNTSYLRDICVVGIIVVLILLNLFLIYGF